MLAQLWKGDERGEGKRWMGSGQEVKRGDKTHQGFKIEDEVNWQCILHGNVKSVYCISYIYLQSNAKMRVLFEPVTVEVVWNPLKSLDNQVTFTNALYCMLNALDCIGREGGSSGSHCKYDNCVHMWTVMGRPKRLGCHDCIPMVSSIPNLQGW